MPLRQGKPIPVLIDTDMGVDDAVALVVALSTPALDGRAIVATGGNVPLPQAEANVGRVLAALAPPRRPAVGRGLDQPEAQGPRAAHVHGDDGLAGADLPGDPHLAAQPFLNVYRDAIEAGATRLHVIAIGPLTTLAAVIQRPALAAGIERIHVMGGAVWSRGNVTESAEFNFHRDPAAADAVLHCGRPVTLTPLDVTQSVCIDETHVARLAAGPTRGGQMLARVLGNAIGREPGGRGRRFILHDAVAVGGLLWPDLFVRTRVQVAVEQAGPHAGRSRPVLGGADAARVDVHTAMKAVDFLENLLECIGREAFVV